ncbi:hypothetical protein M407DRAFT_5617 [Tulasnella calospora MUT 4182]|uniref:Ubiquinol-cytochrome C reductase hinge domain-containing protein n=1 Tax=Tulasnella calospora MUT 4182 TaxID=1051891 RepID=A0A0C3QPW0_9AGAM|nr:hypothetical protein M407DRAFT_5617 [Tulasnella calospora MUT 4182]
MTWFTSFFNPVQCEEAHQPESAVAATHAEDKHEAEETPKTEDKEEEEEAPAEEEEEEEPEDALPAIREECKASKNCVQLTKHFEHCEEKVNAGKGFKGEDCVEELCT